MNKLCTLGGAMVFGYGGWFLGSGLGFGWAFVISSVGSLLGVYLGWKLAQKFE